MAECGVYRWLNLETGKSYVGSAADIEDRRKQHIRMLKAGAHHSRKFQNSWNKHGETAFQFERVVHCSVDELISQEQAHIDAFDAYENGYNMCPIAGAPFRGRKHSEETRVLMSGPRGKQTPEWIENRAKTRRGVPLSSQGRANVKAAAQNRKLVSEEVREIQTKALTAFNQSKAGRLVASERRKKFWVNGVYDDLKEANIQMFQSKEHRQLVSENTKEWNRRRTSEFNSWCARKRGAKVKGIPFMEPRPAQMYLA
jgi:group I intron endonuclease